MKETLSKLFPTWVYWAGFVFTIAGVIYSIGHNLAWLGFLALSPLIIASFHSALSAHSESAKALRELHAAGEREKETQQRLQQISTEHLLRLEQLIIRGTFEESFGSVHAICAYIGRLQKLTKTEFTIRQIFARGDLLYVAAKTPTEALPHLKEHDPFYMFSRTAGMHHLVAKLRLHQVNEKEEAIFLQVTGELDKSTMASLRTLAQSTSVKGLKDYCIAAEVNIAPFTQIDMQTVTDALEILWDEIGKAKQNSL